VGPTAVGGQEPLLRLLRHWGAWAGEEDTGEAHRMGQCLPVVVEDELIPPHASTATATSIIETGTGTGTDAYLLPAVAVTLRLTVGPEDGTEGHGRFLVLEHPLPGEGVPGTIKLDLASIEIVFAFCL